ncbi:hypothetical protein GEMRC1_010324 [Eukaryota sp. GEM-RC1]
MARKNNITDVYFKYKNSKNSFTKEYPSANRFAKVWNNDRILVDQLIDRISQMDEQRKDNPLFCWAMSISSHNPYTSFDSTDNVGSEIPDDIIERYKRVLKYSDYHLVKRFVEFLKTRENSKNTIIVFVGDHAAYAGQLSPKCDDCPSSPLKTIKYSIQLPLLPIWATTTQELSSMFPQKIQLFTLLLVPLT